MPFHLRVLAGLWWTCVICAFMYEILLTQSHCIFTSCFCKNMFWLFAQPKETGNGSIKDLKIFQGKERKKKRKDAFCLMQNILSPFLYYFCAFLLCFSHLPQTLTWLLITFLITEWWRGGSTRMVRFLPLHHLCMYCAVWTYSSAFIVMHMRSSHCLSGKHYICTLLMHNSFVSLAFTLQRP